jgi:prophage regulatory protein
MSDITTLLRLPDVLARTGLSRSSVYDKAAAGEFPQPIKIGERASAWIAAEVDAWIEERIRASRDTQQ